MATKEVVGRGLGALALRFGMHRVGYRHPGLQGRGSCDVFEVLFNFLVQRTSLSFAEPFALSLAVTVVRRDTRHLYLASLSFVVAWWKYS